MKICNHILYAIDDAECGKWDSALLHACIAIDGTARKLYPNEKINTKRYTQCVRDYYWIIEPMMAGINLEETRFTNVPLKSTDAPDLADIIYTKFRCNDAHGEPIPEEFSITLSHDENAHWVLADKRLQLPVRIIWALIAVSVFSKVNADEQSKGDYFFFLRHPETKVVTKFIIANWWGKEDNFRPIAAEHNKLRVKLDNLIFPPK